MAEISWQAPSFLWKEVLSETGLKQRLHQPAVFRFDNDSFMEEFADRLEKDPSGLKDLAFLNETWIEKRSGWLREGDPKNNLMRKLYQPTHGYFYIAAAMLICRIPGFPDRNIDTSNDEKVSFVMRRLVPSEKNKTINVNNPSTYVEYGMIAEGKGWRKASPNSSAFDEERIPLFPMYFEENRIKRRLLAGLIPVSKKEIYQAEPVLKNEDFSESDKNNDELAKENPALIEFKTRIIHSSFENLIEYGTVIDVTLAREVLVNIVLDIAKFLRKYIKNVYDSIITGRWTGGNYGQSLYNKLVEVKFAENLLSQNIYWKDILKEDKQKIETLINQMTHQDIIDSILVFKKNSTFDEFIGLIKISLPQPGDTRIALLDKYVIMPFLDLYLNISENPGTSDDTARKSFLFISLDLAAFLNEHLGKVFEAIIKDTEIGLEDNAKNLFSRFNSTIFYGNFNWGDVLRETWDERYGAISGRTEGRIISHASTKNIMDAIANLGITGENYTDSHIYQSIVSALPENPAESPAPSDSDNNEIDKSAGAIFFLRFVYDRPKCRNISESIVSQPTKMFQLANFFDPDAPARPLKITMPIDTSIEGIKKYPRNVSFLLSNKLRSQMDSIKSSTKLSDLDSRNLFGKSPSFNLGMVCSFSIPIITICALILLMIIVNLLNIIFWWLPYFRICFPLNLKVK